MAQSTTISLALQLKVAGGPTFSTSYPPISVEAYDVIAVAIPGAEAGTSGKATVEVQPASDTKQIQLLMISSDKYGGELTYSIEGGAEDVKLDAQQLFVGEGAIGLLGSAPRTLEFENNFDRPMNISILVGRNATPGP